MEIDPKLESLLVKAKDLGASDLHLTVGTVPAVRVNNELTRMEGETMLLPEDTRRLLESIMDEEHAETFRRQGRRISPSALPGSDDSASMPTDKEARWRLRSAS